MVKRRSNKLVNTSKVSKSKSRKSSNIKTRSFQKKRPSSKDQPKNASLKDFVKTVVKIVKKPFGGGGRKKAALAPEIQKQIEIARDIEKNEILDQREIDQTVQNPFNDFFYTPTAFIDGFEDSDILDFIHSKYPEFMSSVEDDSKIRKQVLLLLDDDQFVKRLFSFFDIKMQDFFKFLFRLNSQMFKTAFIQKLHIIVATKKYS